MNKNPVIVPSVLHIIIPCIVLFTKTYELNFLCFILGFSISLLRGIITFIKICKNTNISLSLTYFILFLDFSIFCIYLVFSILLKDMIIALYCILYFLGFSWLILQKLSLIKKIIVIDECSICYEELNENIIVLICGHSYHNECINKWIIEKKNCPYCREQINI